MAYQKAFDTVPHRKLVDKLASYGIRGEVLRWIESYLNDRRQRVVVNGKSDEWTDVTYRIPQGSVLGPILFVIYINDMPDGLSSEIFLFADDTKIFKEIKQKRDCDLLQNDLNFMQLWTDIWLLRFHSQKCHAMTIGVRKTNLVEYSLPDGKGGGLL